MAVQNQCLSLQLAQAGSMLLHCCGNTAFGCDLVISPLLCWSKPNIGILGHCPKAFVDFGEYVFCHPGCSARRNDVECTSASATRVIFKGVLH